MARCANCDFDNPSGFGYCGACGAALETRNTISDERKVVTILFCDLVGFTARSESMDPEDVRAVLRPYHSRSRTVIDRFGGVVEKFIGDAVMASFGAPRSHEDDPERAVRAALRILEIIEQLNLETSGPALQVRIGINTGEAVVSVGSRPEEGEGMVAGDVVNTAARLETAAAPQTVVVGEATYVATESLFDYESLERVGVKGKAAPVAVYRVLGAKSRVGASAFDGPTTPFVGRVGEMEILRGTFERVLRERSLQLVTLLGEPGIGKTRLVHELAQYVDGREELVAWREGRCLPYGEGITFWALSEIVKAQCGILESDQSAEVMAKITESLDGLDLAAPDVTWITSRLSPLVGMAGKTDEVAGAEETFTAWCRFLEAVAERTPLVLVIDDLHWADDALCSFLEFFVDWSVGARILIVCAARPELYERWPTWGAATRNFTALSLSPLSDEDSDELLVDLGKRITLDSTRRESVRELAAGNPLYAEQLVGMLRDSMGNTGIEVPRNLKALIAARLDYLPAEEKSLLHDAAVVGKVFWPGALAQIGGIDEATVATRLRRLARREFVRSARSSSVGHEAEYSFSHALVRDVAYSQIPRRERAARHRAAARWIEGVAGERVTDHAELIAHHCLEALKLGELLGEKGEPGFVSDAARFLKLAGDRAFKLDPGSSFTYYEHALELSPQSSGERGRLLRATARASRAINRYDAAAELLEEAVTELVKANELAAAAEAMAGRAILAHYLEPHRVEELADEAAAMTRGVAPSHELAEALGQIAYLKTLHGHLREAVALCEQALEADPGNPRALENRGFARLDLGDVAGIADLRASLDRLTAEGSSQQLVTTYNNLGDALLEVEGPSASLAACEQGVEVARSRGLVEGEVHVKTTMMSALFGVGRWDEVLGMAADLEASSHLSGAHRTKLSVDAYAVNVLVRRGEIEAAVGISPRLMPQAHTVGDLQSLTLAVPAAVLVDLASGRDAHAVANMKEFAAAAAEGPGWYVARYLPDLVRACGSIGELDLAGELLSSAATATTPRSQLGVEAARAILAEANGALESAASLYERAAIEWRSFGVLVEEAHALLGRGRCLLHMDAPQAAKPELASARAIFQELKAFPTVQEIERM